MHIRFQIRATRAAAALVLGVAGAPVERMGYTLDFEARTSGPINAVWFDVAHGSFWGGSSSHGDDYGIAW